MSLLAKNRRERSSNIELLRIISAILIVIHHYAGYGFLELRDGGALSFNRIWVQLLTYGGKFAVILFVLITGYFMINSQFKAKKAIKLWVQVGFYSVVISGIAIALGASTRVKDIPMFALPILYKTYWFATIYFLLYLFSGFLNKFLLSLRKDEFIKLIVLMFVVFSIFPTFLHATSYVSEFATFIMIYSLAAYMRLHKPRIFRGKHCLMIGIAVYLLAFATVPIIDLLSLRFPFLINDARYFASLNSTFMLVAAMFVFAGFCNMQMKPSKLINTIATTTFGIYLIHNNTWLVKILWTNIFHNLDYADSPWLVVHSVLSVAIVCVACILIDLIYQHTFEKWIMKIVDRYWDRIVGKCKKIQTKMLNFCR